ncbi:hypothetical protein MM236_12860 [Belliella sp. DSM 107340]|uniref:TolB-like 6-blade propeller-like n=1 Tax=Belliella calami TaxID=2923436 RepID=A0ABS9URK8_9BACT|nr:hypothetical protein [Belliella calami]MCH7398888.1 hypothetical protein [Belliella calami]
MKIQIAKQLYVFAFLLGVFFISSCSNSERSEGTTISYELMQVDSFRVDRENRIRILDFNSNRSEYLAFDLVTHEFVQLDQRGKVLNAVMKQGEGPDEYNTSILAASFNHEDDGYFLQSSNEFIWYSDDWKVKERLHIPANSTIHTYGGPKLSVPYFRIKDSSSPYFLTSFFSGIQVHAFETKDDLSEEMMIEYYNPSKDSLEWALPFDKQYFSSSELSEKKISPKQIYVLNREANLMYLTFENSKTIGVYDLSKDFELKQTLPYEHQNFIPTNKSRNIALFDLGSDKLALLYYSGLSEGDIQLKKDADSDYLFYQDPALFRFIIIEKDGSGSHEIMFPSSGEPHSEFVQLPDNRILIRKKDNPNIEQEYSDYLVFDLK